MEVLLKLFRWRWGHVEYSTAWVHPASIRPSPTDEQCVLAVFLSGTAAMAFATAKGHYSSRLLQGFVLAQA